MKMASFQCEVFSVNLNVSEFYRKNDPFLTDQVTLLSVFSFDAA